MPSKTIAAREERILNTLSEPFRSKATLVHARINERLKEHKDIILSIQSGFRDAAEQQKEWEKGRKLDPVTGLWRVVAANKVVTRAQPGYSAHNYRLANHAVLMYNTPTVFGPAGAWLQSNDPRWRTIVGEEVERAGLIWGGRFKSLYDAAHFEDPGWEAIAKERNYKGLTASEWL